MILQVSHLTKAFGGLKAVDDISLDVRRGSVHAIIGPNGSGKSTFFNVVTRYLTADSGQILFDGEDISALAPHAICQRGIARCFQVASIFPRLTIAENVRLALISTKRMTFNFWTAADRALKDETDAILEEVGLVEQRDAPAALLSQGDKKRLELAIALGCHPKLLLLDEPTAGMSAEETRSTTKLIRELRDSTGLTVLFTEHDMSVVFDISERISVLYQGAIIAEGLPSDVRCNDEVQRIYLGGAEKC